jgi:hypothetical protein
MTDHVDADKQRQVEELFAIASSAARTELNRALRDPVLWGAQFVECVAAVVKLLCLGLALGLVEMYFLRLPEQAALELACMPVLAAIGWNPRGCFCKNHFRMRANAAFDHALQSIRCQ